MDYGAVFKRAWDVTWKYKGLWVLGILAGCSGGAGGGGGRPSSAVQYQFRGRTPLVDAFLRGIPEGTIITIIVVAILVVILLSLILLVLGILGQGGLIAGFHAADEGIEVKLGEAFRAGAKYFWRMLGVRILFWLAGLVVWVTLVLAVVLITVGTLGIGLVVLLPLLCLLIPVGAVVTVLVDAYVMLTQAAVVVEGRAVFEAFRRSWQVATQNLGPILLVTLIVGGGGVIVGLVLSAPLVFIALPLLSGMLIGTERAAGSGLFFSLLCLVVYLPVLIVLGGVLTTFITGVWTLTYRRLTGQPGAPLPAQAQPAAA
jgi:hypothetical protein